MSEVVFDASAVLAFLNQEPGAGTIAPLFEQAAIGDVNFAEVVTKMAAAGISGESIAQILDNLQLEVVAFEVDQAFQTGLLRPSTQALGLSLGDRACLALGLHLNQPVITADRQWQNLDLALKIQVLR